MDQDYSPIIQYHEMLRKKKCPSAFHPKALRKDFIAYGKHKGMKGAGLFSWMKKGFTAVKNFVSGYRKNFSPSIRKFLKQYGDRQILNIKVARTPIFELIEKIASFLSNRTFDHNKKRLNYDKLFHLYLSVTIEGGITVKIEKNHIINIEVDRHPENEEAEYIQIPSRAGLTINTILDDGKKIVSEADFFKYAPTSTNCQHFILTLLTGSNLITAELRNFILQDAEGVLRDNDYLKHAGNVITDVASRIDHAVQGSGMVFPKPRYEPVIVQIKKYPI